MRTDQVTSYLEMRQLRLPFQSPTHVRNKIFDSHAKSLAGRPRKFRVTSLFSGIGGFELGLQRAGHETLLLCELDPGAVAVLETRFHGISNHSDIRTLKCMPSETELVVAGFPCQDLSQAGRTAGITGENSGLISEVFRLLEHRPVPWLLLENVPFMLQLGQGRALAMIVDVLEKFGYQWAYRVIDSRAFGLPQRRERVFLVASLEDDPRCVLFADETGPPDQAMEAVESIAYGFYWTEGIRGLGWAVNAVPTLKGGSTIGIPSPPAILLPTGEIVKPEIRDTERMQGFPADWTLAAEKVTKRGHRWKLVGNAVTVDVVEWIGERLSLPGEYDPYGDTPIQRGKTWPRAAWNLGQGRFSANLSSWPVRRQSIPLHKFLQYEPTLLSVKATAGFLSRAKSGSLRFPDGFLEKVQAHLDRMLNSVSA